MRATALRMLMKAREYIAREYINFVVLIVVFVGIILSFVAAAGYYLSGPTSQGTPSSLQILYGELFKTALTFTLIAAGGGYIKIVGDRFLEDQRLKQAQLNEREAERRSIIDEFVNTFSGFYSLRKHYESRARPSNEEPSNEEFKKYFLEKSTELEGQYGALKVRAIQHFKLPKGSFKSQKISDLQTKLQTALKKLEDTKNSKEAEQEVARVRLDLLGEYYDRWRHALENGWSEILPKDRLKKFGEQYSRLDSHWEQYEALLTYFEEKPLEEDG